MSNSKPKTFVSVTTPRENRKYKDVFIKIPVCWNEDYESEVFAEYTKYYRKYVLDGSESNQHRVIRYKLYVPIKSSEKIIVEVRLWTEGGQATITSDPLPMYQALGMQEVVEQGLDFWNKRFAVKISDPTRAEVSCRTKVMEIEYRVVWLDSSVSEEFNDIKKPAKAGFYHSKMLVYKTMERERVANGILEISLDTNTYVAAHEYGHIIGLPDEYPDDEDGKCVVYVKPDGSTDDPVDLTEYTRKSSPLAGIMSTAYSFQTVPRHAWCVAIEVRDLLSQKTGRKIACEIIQLR